MLQLGTKWPQSRVRGLPDWINRGVKRGTITTCLHCPNRHTEVIYWAGLAHSETDFSNPNTAQRIHSMIGTQAMGWGVTPRAQALATEWRKVGELGPLVGHHPGEAEPLLPSPAGVGPPMHSYSQIYTYFCLLISIKC